MALFPKIDSPCPYRDNPSAIMDGENCRVCKRQVFDLTYMSDEERVAFLKGCTGQVCVSFKLSVRPVLAAAIAIAAVGAPVAAAACDAVETVEITMGGIHDPANAKYVQVKDEAIAPALPVVYEAKKDATNTPSEPGK